MAKNKIEKYVGKNEYDQLAHLKQERKKLEVEIKEHEDREKRIKNIAKEKENIALLQRQLKEKKKKKSGFRKTVTKLKRFEGQMEKAVHPERFLKSGKRKKGRAGIK